MYIEGNIHILAHFYTEQTFTFVHNILQIKHMHISVCV